MADLTQAWHIAEAEYVEHAAWCRGCVVSEQIVRRCPEGQRLSGAAITAWGEMKAAQYLGVA